MMAIILRRAYLALRLVLVGLLASCAIGMDKAAVGNLAVIVPAREPMSSVSLLFLRPTTQEENLLLMRGYRMSGSTTPYLVKRTGQRAAEFMRLNGASASFAGEFGSVADLRAAMKFEESNGHYTLVFVPIGSTIVSQGYREVSGSTTYRASLFSNVNAEMLMQFTVGLDHAGVGSAGADLSAAAWLNALYGNGYLRQRPEKFVSPPFVRY
jgi:hypothetical protein